MAGWNGGKGVADAPCFGTGYVTMQGVGVPSFTTGRTIKINNWMW
jgi:hypothetical protein